MKSEVDGLLRELRCFQGARGTIGPIHPRVATWVSAVRNHLDRQGDPRARQRFERFRLTRMSSSMWHRWELSPPELQAFLAELDQVAALLSQTFPVAAAKEVFSAEADARAETLPAFLHAPSKQPQIEEEDPVESKRQERPEEPSTGGSWEVSLTARMEKLFAELKHEITKPKGDLAGIKSLMGELLELKKVQNLTHELQTECARPEAPWDSVREPMAKLWSIRKDILLELMPRLLTTS